MLQDACARCTATGSLRVALGPVAGRLLASQCRNRASRCLASNASRRSFALGAVSAKMTSLARVAVILAAAALLSSQQTSGAALPFTSEFCGEQLAACRHECVSRTKNCLCACYDLAAAKATNKPTTLARQTQRLLRQGVAKACGVRQGDVVLIQGPGEQYVVEVELPSQGSSRKQQVVCEAFLSSHPVLAKSLEVAQVESVDKFWEDFEHLHPSSPQAETKSRDAPRPASTAAHKMPYHQHAQKTRPGRREGHGDAAVIASQIQHAISEIVQSNDNFVSTLTYAALCNNTNATDLQRQLHDFLETSMRGNREVLIAAMNAAASRGLAVEEARSTLVKVLAGQAPVDTLTEKVLGTTSTAEAVRDFFVELFSADIKGEHDAFTKIVGLADANSVNGTEFKSAIATMLVTLLQLSDREIVQDIVDIALSSSELQDGAMTAEDIRMIPADEQVDAIRKLTAPDGLRSEVMISILNSMNGSKQI